jgi:hypothetical protein
MKDSQPRGARGLWRTALFILVVGGSCSYFLAGHQALPAQKVLFSLVLSITLLVSGILIICATSDWWFKH